METNTAPLQTDSSGDALPVNGALTEAVPAAPPPAIENPFAAPLPIAAESSRSNAARITGRIAGFCATLAAIWGGYFLWRPPLPILNLRHVEQMSNPKQIALTFDDAPHPLSTPLLLASLKRADVKATFFVVGEGLRLYPELAYRMVLEGHSLANHSENHRNLTRSDVPVSDYDMEVKQCFTRIEALGQKTKLFRPPGGGMNRAVMDYLYRHDYTLAWWSNNIGDWARPPAWKIVERVNMGVRPGDIVLLHDAGIGTAQALPSIIRNSRDQGLDFVPMPEK